MEENEKKKWEAIFDEESDYTNPSETDWMKFFEQNGLLDAWKNAGVKNIYPYHDLDKCYEKIKSEFEAEKNNRIAVFRNEGLTTWCHDWFDTKLKGIKGTPDRTANLKICYERLKKEVLKPKKDLEFKDLFFAPEYAEIVDKYLEEYEHTENGQWVSGGNKKKIATAYYVLIDLEIIKKGKVTTQLRVFCNHYGIGKNPNEFRNLTIRPKYEPEKKSDYIEFQDLFNKIKELKK